MRQSPRWRRRAEIDPALLSGISPPFWTARRERLCLMGYCARAGAGGVRQQQWLRLWPSRAEACAVFDQAPSASPHRASSRWTTTSCSAWPRQPGRSTQTAAQAPERARDRIKRGAEPTLAGGGRGLGGRWRPSGWSASWTPRRRATPLRRLPVATAVWREQCRGRRLWQPARGARVIQHPAR